jgi:hypothetical protein
VVGRRAPSTSSAWTPASRQVTTSPSSCRSHRPCRRAAAPRGGASARTAARSCSSRAHAAATPESGGVGARAASSRSPSCTDAASVASTCRAAWASATSTPRSIGCMRTAPSSTTWRTVRRVTSNSQPGTVGASGASTRIGRSSACSTWCARAPRQQLGLGREAGVGAVGAAARPAGRSRGGLGLVEERQPERDAVFTQRGVVRTGAVGVQHATTHAQAGQVPYGPPPPRPRPRRRRAWSPSAPTHHASRPRRAGTRRAPPPSAGSPG